MYVQVIVDISHTQVDKLFEYAVPPDMQVCVGQRVEVPFTTKTVEGIVLQCEKTPSIDPKKIKTIVRVLEPYPAVSEEQIALARTIKERYQTTFAAALRLMIPNSLRGHKTREKTQTYVYLDTEKQDLALASVQKADGSVRYAKQFEVLNRLIQEPLVRSSELNPSALKTLIKKGFVRQKRERVFRDAFDMPVQKIPDYTLSAEQQKAFDTIMARPGGQYLLHGVTGSGKTEIYIRVIREMLKAGKTAILLVPEISLTPQTYRFLAQRLTCGIAVFHSGLSDGERLDEWEKVVRGDAKVVLGARSAVFAPLKNLGAVIIDEEHENSYKADHYPKYTAHEIARLRCKTFGAKLILGSATPSIGVYHAAMTGEYTLLRLKNRLFGLNLPQVRVVDMREELKKGNRSVISAALAKSLERTLAQNKQAMLFLNRRGYSTFVMCRACGYTVQCDACEVTMTYHKAENVLKCHYCGRTKPVTNICPVCGKPYLKYFGTGTQQIEEQVQKMFPEARIIRMDLDTMTHKGAHLKVFDDFSAHRADILIGTQMITKGFDFKNVALSAVLAADTMLNIPDYRSAERTFMHITQIAGRAGRADAGEVILQTYNPAHYAVQFAREHDYEGFYAQEIALRKTAKLPPFSRFVQIQFSGKNEEDTIAAVKDFLRKLNTQTRACREELLSIRANASPIRRINEMARYEIFLSLTKAADSGTMKVIKELFANTQYPGVLVGMDIDE